MKSNEYLEQLEKKYEQYLQSLVNDKSIFPIVLRGGKAKPNTTRELHEAIAVFQKFEKKSDRLGWSVQWEEWKSKRLGYQKWPKQIEVASEEDYLALIGKEDEVVLFRSLLDKVLRWKPQLNGLFEQEPRLLLQYTSEWQRIIAVIDFCLTHQLESFYLRNIPVSVHTKYLEENKAILKKLISFLDPQRFDINQKDFEIFLGVIKKPKLFSARWLDDICSNKYTENRAVFAITADDLKKVKWDIEQVWVVENETSLFMLPQKRATLAICGFGKAVELLADIDLFASVKLFYWGDMDEDGFLILSRFRSLYPRATSCMMDLECLERHHESMDLQPAKYTHKEINGLTSGEQYAYQKLFQSNGRLEQERIQMSYICDFVKFS